MNRTVKKFHLNQNEVNRKETLFKPNEVNRKEILFKPNEPNCKEILFKPNEPNCKELLFKADEVNCGRCRQDTPKRQAVDTKNSSSSSSRQAVIQPTSCVSTCLKSTHAAFSSRWGLRRHPHQHFVNNIRERDVGVWCSYWPGFSRRTVFKINNIENKK